MLLRNVGIYPRNYTVTKARRTSSSSSQLWKHQISHLPSKLFCQYSTQFSVLFSIKFVKQKSIGKPLIRFVFCFEFRRSTTAQDWWCSEAAWSGCHSPEVTHCWRDLNSLSFKQKPICSWCTLLPEVAPGHWNWINIKAVVQNHDPYIFIINCRVFSQYIITINNSLPDTLRMKYYENPTLIN
jgi:hypothetical protein